MKTHKKSETGLLKDLSASPMTVSSKLITGSSILNHAGRIGNNEGSMGTNFGGNKLATSPGANTIHKEIIVPRSPQNSGEKKFVETSTGEKLIINLLGAFASLKLSDKYIPVKNFQQLLYPPFCHIKGTLENEKSTPGGVSIGTRRSLTQVPSF